MNDITAFSLIVNHFQLLVLLLFYTHGDNVLPTQKLCYNVIHFRSIPEEDQG